MADDYGMTLAEALATGDEPSASDAQSALGDLIGDLRLMAEALELDYERADAVAAYHAEEVRAGAPPDGWTQAQESAVQQLRRRDAE
jgi:hypothetical protein